MPARRNSTRHVSGDHTRRYRGRTRRAGRGRGGGRSATAAQRVQNGSIQVNQQPTHFRPNAPDGTSSAPQAYGAHSLPVSAGNQSTRGERSRCRGEQPHSARGTRGGNLSAIEGSPPSSHCNTYEEWRAASDLEKRKREEEDAAMLLEENMRALQVNNPFDADSVSAFSVSTEPKSEHPGPLPHYAILEPMRRTPSSATSSWETPQAMPNEVPDGTLSLQALEPVRINQAEPQEVKQLSPIGFDEDFYETMELIPDLPTSLSFHAPDWRVCSQTQPQSREVDSSSDVLISGNDASAESGTGKVKTVEEITAEWDRAFL